MSIPEAQLETWCNQGATVTSAGAYASIKAALAAPSSKVRTLNTDVYLQGSYGNSTNIFADSDVDVVVQYDSVWYRDISKLPANQQQAYNASYSNSDYVWKQFRTDVVQRLQGYYGAASVKPSNKAIRVNVPNGRTVDVVPTFQFRDYSAFLSHAIASYVEGVRFEDNSGRVVVNYPKLHMQNGEAKNGATRTAYRYKQTVRMFKNARNCAVDRKLISASCAPSYFVECLLFNVPDAYFVQNRQKAFSDILKFAAHTLDTNAARCQNGHLFLFGNSPEQWTVARAAELLAGLDRLWNNW